MTAGVDRNGLMQDDGEALRAMNVVVVSGGSVLVDPTGETGEPVYTHAVAFRDGRVVALGDAAIDLRAGDATTVDLEGGVLAPALGDGHAHPLLGGLERFGPQIRSAPDLQGIIDAVAVWRAENPSAEWIIGGSYDATFSDKGHFDARWLDEVTGSTPTVLRSWDYHSVWVNSAALAAAGITSETPDPPFGRIIRRPDGSPLGTLFEDAANDFMAQTVPAYSFERRLEALQYATSLCAAQGTTWLQDAWVEPDDVDVYLAAAGQGQLHVRINLAMKTSARAWREHVDQFIAARQKVRDLDSDCLDAETVKIFVDGIVETHTASLLTPYADQPEESGLAHWDPENLNQAVTAFDAAGFQLHFHAIGDAANRNALNSIEAAAIENGPSARRHVIAHVAVLHPDDVDRFAKLGVIANFQPYWAKCDAVMRDLTIPHLGHPRSEWQYLIGSLQQTGATISFGSDWPVTTLDWRPALATAITRTNDDSPGEDPWLPQERVDARTAYAAYTKGLAVQASAETDRGTLRQGQIADAVWLSSDPLRVDPDAIHDIFVRGTWLAGERIYQA